MVISNEASSNNGRILIADRERVESELMQFNLENAGYKVDIFHDVHDAMEADLCSYVLFIVDFETNSRNGVNLARHLKQNNSTADIPLIFCSSLDGELDVIETLDGGADDYILKPFSMRELIARVNALLRRQRISSHISKPSTKPTLIQHSDLVADLKAKKVTLNGKELSLFNDEYRLFAFLFGNRNRLFDIDEIYDNAWPEKEDVDMLYLEQVLTSLRQKLGHHAIYCVNRHNCGYGYLE